MAYEPDTGVTVDGIEPDGTVNGNSGAESTIHGLLAALLLDAHPTIARAATSIVGLSVSEGTVWIQAEDQQLPDGASIIAPVSAWTGEGNIMGSLVHVPAGATLTFDLEPVIGSLEHGTWAGASVHPVVHQVPGAAGATTWRAVANGGGRTRLGSLTTDGGDQWVTEWPGIMNPRPLATALPDRAHRIEMTTDADIDMDAVLLLAGVTAVRYTASNSRRVVLRGSTSISARYVPVAAGEKGPAWDSDGDSGRTLTHGRRSLVGGGFSVSRLRA